MEFVKEWPLWVQWLGGISGALVSLGIIWKLGVVTLARALWAAILAAPEIADGIHELGELIRGDVLGQIAAMNLRLGALETRVMEHRDELTRQETHLGAFDEALHLQRQVAETQGARITSQELALEAIVSEQRRSSPSAG